MAPQEQKTRNGPLRPRTVGVKKQRKGFNVGPALPEGPQRRRVQQIKRGLIENAKLRKQYAKLKGQYPSASKASASQDDDIPPLGDSGVSPPPFRDSPPPQQALEDASEVEWSDEDEAVQQTNSSNEDQQAGDAGVAEDDEAQEVYRGRQRRPKPMPFRREERQAERQKREQTERREAREKAERERKQKIEERERFRKAMAKARTGGKNGQRKLGRESRVLLEKVQRMMT